MAVRTARRADDAPGISLDDVVERADRTLAGAVEHLKGLQHAEGWWKGELETNVTMDAEDMMLRQFLGILTPEDAAASARWIRSNQRSDGSWANFYEGPIDLSTTVEAYVALRLAGDDPEAPHMAKAAACVRDAGGFERSRVFTRMWLALFGLWSWDELPALPPEVIFLPRWFPLNVYDFACWARQTIVALTVVGSYRPVRPIGFSIDELRSPEPRARDRNAPLFTAAGVLERLDVVLHQWERLAKTWPVRAGVREVALSKAENWILRRQEADGGWGGIQPPWVYSIIALHLRGYPLDHPALAKGLAGLEGFTIREDGPDGPTRRLEACQSPVWDTALAAIALADAGAAAGDDSLRRASDWILVEEVRVVGDWAVRRPGLQPSGWAFEFANDNYPDIDDTAEVILALRKASGTPAEPTEAVLARAEAWVVGMASRDGGWAAFDADNVRGICRDLPFCDFGEVIDPPSADVTARCWPHRRRLIVPS
jgi:squalene-hopene/tetraprenyl-beta-curcumene cyclase